MRKVGRVAAGLWLAAGGPIFAAGVTPYLPLNLEPEIERQIERVIILGDQPVLSRPIAAATVLDALPKACKIDLTLCEKVQRYLARYTHDSGVTHGSVEGAVASGSNPTIPNRYGMGDKSEWDVSGAAYVQPNDYVLLNVGGVSYQGKT